MGPGKSIRARISAVIVLASVTALAGGAFAGAEPHAGDRPHGASAKAQPGHAPGPGEGVHHTEQGAGAEAEHDETGPPEAMNWWHGLLGAKPGVEPSLLWRSPDEPPPFLASLINFGLLVFLAVRFGQKPLASALHKRKETIMREIEDAQRLRRAAEERLREYEGRLAMISEELERVRRAFREQGEQDKERIIREAEERRERMRHDAEVVLLQETKQMRHEVLVEVVDEATKLAADLLATGMTLGDHDRFAEAFLGQLAGRPGKKRVPTPAGSSRGGVA